jgi:hypothetical protein
LAPAAKAKLVVNDMGVSELTNKEICSLLVTFYAATEKLEKKKTYELVAQLRQEMEAVKVTCLMGHQEKSSYKMGF